MKPFRLKRDETLALVDQRASAVRNYLLCAQQNDTDERSFRMAARGDIRDAAQAADQFPEDWWGMVVFTCFGSVLGAKAVAPKFQSPLPSAQAEAVLAGIAFPRGSVGHHRIQPAVTGAKEALVSACRHHDFLHDVLHSGEDFDTRYRRLQVEARRKPC
jgi:hypothetical protein